MFLILKCFQNVFLFLGSWLFSRFKKLKNFLPPKTKLPIDFFAQNSLQFSRRARRDEPKLLTNSLPVRPEGFEPPTFPV